MDSASTTLPNQPSGGLLAKAHVAQTTGSVAAGIGFGLYFVARHARVGAGTDYLHGSWRQIGKTAEAIDVGGVDVALSHDDDGLAGSGIAVLI